MDNFAHGVFVGLMIGLFLAWTAWSLTSFHYKYDAVKYGYAQYVIIDNLSGKSAFKWNAELEKDKVNVK